MEDEEGKYYTSAVVALDILKAIDLRTLLGKLDSLSEDDMGGLGSAAGDGIAQALGAVLLQHRFHPVAATHGGLDVDIGHGGLACEQAGGARARSLRLRLEHHGQHHQERHCSSANAPAQGRHCGYGATDDGQWERWSEAMDMIQPVASYKLIWAKVTVIHGLRLHLSLGPRSWAPGSGLGFL